MRHRRFFFPGERISIPVPRSSNDGKKLPRERPLTPLTKPPKLREVLVYDFESKNDESQEEGFTRPFMVGFLDHEQVFHTFFDDPNVFQEDFREHALSDKGCIGKFCRHVLGYPKRSGYKPPPWTSDHCDLYAHNGGRFDVTFLIAWLFRHRKEFETRLVIVQGRVQRMDVWPRGKKFSSKRAVSFLDSSLILPMKLAEATKLFSSGETKKEEFDRNTSEFRREEWTEYNRRDCIGLRDSLVGFRRMLENLGGEMSMTAPSASMKLFRRRFLRKSYARAMHFPGCQGDCLGCDRGELCDGHCHGCLHAWIRSGYFGGRVEIFHRFAPAPCYYYDRNSSYPASMMEPMPVGIPVAIQSESDFWKEHEERRAAGQLAFVECSVSIPDSCKIPPLPHLHEGKLKFPTGSFSGVFDYDELIQIFDPFVGGSILKIEKAVWFEGEKVFDEFVTTLYEIKKTASAIKERLKKEGRDPTDMEKVALAIGEIAKLMMNSLYGKFAMNPEREEVLMLDPESDPWPSGGKPLDGRHESCPVWTVPKYVSPSYLVPQWSTRITALSRMSWWQAARQIMTIAFFATIAISECDGSEDIDTLRTLFWLASAENIYGDTDADVTTIPFPADMVDQTELGYWKQEYADKYLSGEFPLPKTYMLVDEFGRSKPIVHMKGVPREFQDRATFEMLKGGGELRKEKARTSQPKTVLRNMQKGGPAGIVMLDSVKKLRSVYDKRVVLDDGSTTPVHLEEV